MFSFCLSPFELVHLARKSSENRAEILPNYKSICSLALLHFVSLCHGHAVLVVRKHIPFLSNYPASDDEVGNIVNGLSDGFPFSLTPISSPEDPLSACLCTAFF